MLRAVMQGYKLYVIEVDMNFENQLEEEEQENLITFVEEGSAVLYFNSMEDLNTFLSDAPEAEIVEV